MTNIKESVQTAAALGTGTELLLPHVELHSNCRAVVDGCRGIVAYDETCVKLNCGALLVTLHGDGLCMERLDGTHISVCGTLVSLAFSCM